MVDRIEHAVPANPDHHQPRESFEPHDRGGDEQQRGQGLLRDDQDRARQCGEQDVVRRDDDQGDRVEGPVTGKPGDLCAHEDHDGKH